MPFCTQCGNRNPDDAKFCAQCGSRLVTPEPAVEVAESSPIDPTATSTITFGAPLRTPAAEERALLDDDDAAAVDGLPSGSALLVVRRGPGAGSRFLLDEDSVTAGRHPESEIFLDDITVSRRHVEFTRSGANFVVTDVGSLNGTYVNRDRIERAELHNGDEVQIGKFRLVFFSGDSADS